MDNVAFNIRKYRLERQMTLDDISAKTGISKGSLSRYENGLVKGIPMRNIELIAKALAVSPSWLIMDGVEKKEVGTLNETERNLIIAYREHPELQMAINKLLGI